MIPAPSPSPRPPLDPGRAPRLVVVAGGSGLIGRALVHQLRRRGDDVRLLVRRAASNQSEISWDPGAGVLDPDALDGIDALVNLGGAGVADHRWTAAYKETIRRSRVEGTSLLARTVARVERPPRRFLQASASGFYGDRGEEVLDETSPGGAGFLADVVRAWEAAADPARDVGLPVVHLRTGIVLDRAGGAAARWLPFFRLGLGGRLGTGRQWWSWITLDDEVRAISHLLDSEITGPVNLTATEPARNADVARAFAQAMHRPALLPAPAFALRAVLGGFASDILGSQRIRPVKLAEDGFAHRHPTIADGAAWLLG